jgi:hypothetical protein
MFDRNPPEKTGLEKERDHALDTLAKLNPTDDGYVQLVDQVGKLSNMIQAEKPAERDKLSPNTALIAGANVAAVMVIVRAELKGHILSSRALPFLGKLFK